MAPLEPSSEASACRPHELGRGGEVGLRSEQVIVPHVGGEPRETRMEIHPSAVPEGEPADRECVPKVDDARTDSSLSRLEAGTPKELPQRPRHELRRAGATVRPHEERAGRADDTGAGSSVARELA